MPSLREAFDQVETVRPGGQCRVCIALQGMPKDDAATLLELMASSASNVSIARACALAGYERLTTSCITRHRKNLCKPLT